MPWVETEIATHPQLEASIMGDELMLSVHCKDWENWKFNSTDPDHSFVMQRCVRRADDVMYDVKTTRHSSCILVGPKDGLFTYKVLDDGLVLVWKRSEAEVFIIFPESSNPKHLLPKVSNTYLAF